MKTYKTHYPHKLNKQFAIKQNRTSGVGRTLCSNRFEQDYTLDIDKVTCEKCLMKLKNKGQTK
ncbi:MAG: hypothetical protein KAQ94_05960 [Arcobacteraceae bacterium]|nr:hypothetical protein [Arcobacteraceae bacterium]